jgi:2-dehydro-3-deoxy-D-arabinonate dehydratase
VKLFRTADGCVAWHEDGWYGLPDCTWQDLTTRDDLEPYLLSVIANLSPSHLPPQGSILAPIAQQEVWAAGVTYYRSRTARMEESEQAGGGTFYDRVYSADRPELFFKATPHRVVGPDAPVHIRSDSKWNVPEPELALLVTPGGKLIGYTIGNDMSSRDIEGENPLYLPQAKVYNRSCALGPGILVTSQALTPETHIYMEILRSGKSCFSDEITLSQMKRDPATLVDYLFRENSFPQGCFLLTGTGIIPGDDFTLEPGDLVRIGIDGIGTLENPVD